MYSIGDKDVSWEDPSFDSVCDARLSDSTFPSSPFASPRQTLEERVHPFPIYFTAEDISSWSSSSSEGSEAGDDSDSSVESAWLGTGVSRT